MASSDRAGRASVVALWIIAVVALLFFLRSAASLLIPIVLGMLISYMLEPIVAFLTRHHVPRLVGASATLLTLLGLAGYGVYTLRDDAAKALEALPEAARRAREMVSSGRDSDPAASVREAAGVLSGSETGGTVGGTGASTRAAEGGKGSAGGQGNVAAQGSGQGGGSMVPGAGSLVQRGVGSLFALAGHLMVIVFLVFFLLLAGDHFRKRLVEIAGPDAEGRRRMATILADINSQIERFLVVRLITAIVVAVLTWLVLAWMDVPQAAVWGILAGVFNSIPYFGPVIVSGGLLIVGLVQGGGLTQALQMSGAALVITSLEGWLLTPPLMGKAERMSALAVFLGLLLWTWVWGAWGTILAVPMLVMVKAVADHTPSLKPLGRLLAP
jgi:predicted PurR-regulated permease PerM